MAKALWEQPITKNVDWGGDSSTGGAAVSGKYVQDFIKSSLNKKFGYMYFNKSANKYYVFADQEDYNKWFANQSLNADLVLATFDAPAPATIKTTVKSPETVTMLFGTNITPIVFHYYIEDNSGNAVSEDVIMRITATSKTTGSIKSDVITIPYDLSTYRMTEKAYAAIAAENNWSESYDSTSTEVIGSRYVYNRINRLLSSADNYSIVITLTGVSTQVSTTIAFSYQLIDLSFETDFDYLTGIDYSSTVFAQNITATGASGFAKTFVMLIDGKPLSQNAEDLGVHIDRIITSGQSLGTEYQKTSKLEIFLKDKNDEPVKWKLNEDDPDYERLNGTEIFGIGKHTLQMYTYINIDANSEPIKSKILFFEFIISSSSIEQTFLLYKSELNEEYDSEKPIQLSGEQYTTIEYSIGVYDSLNRNVPINYLYEIPDTDSAGNIQYDENHNIVYRTLNDIDHTVPSGSVDDIKYTLREGGDIRLTVSNSLSTETIVINIESAVSSIKIEETRAENLFKYSAENRSNSDKEYKIWANTSTIYGSSAHYSQYAGVLNKVNFNELNGWDGNALVLRNRATVTFPFNLFNLPVEGSNAGIEDSGWTFEIDFETQNVQDQEAFVLNFSDPGYRSSLVIKATSAEFTTIKGKSIKTNFKEGERIKIAFIANPLVNTENNQYDPDNLKSDENPNTLFIMVNGVLDRVVKWGDGAVKTDSFKWANPSGENATSFTIGDIDGKATVKIYSIRVYNKALTLDEEFMNYMNDQSGDKLLTVFDKNNIFADNGKTISLDKVKEKIPTLVMYGDYVSFGSFDAKRKKDNTFAEFQYFDPVNKDLNFYARQCWVSCQGTSSMSYPIKNLRLYFGKTANKKTFQIIDQIDKVDENENISTVTINGELNKTPEFETEFWPYSEYGAENEASIRTWADTVLPYSTNKKADGTDGTTMVVKGQNLLGIHDGYHKIGANRTLKGKVALLRKYLQCTELNPEDIGQNFEIGTKPVSIYMVDPDKDPMIIKDAFNDTHTVYSSPGIKGYKKIGDNEYETEYKKQKAFDIFKKLDNAELGAMSDTALSQLFENNDLFISAYRPVIRKNEVLGSKEYETYLDELRYSGVKLYLYKAPAAEGANPTYDDQKKKAIDPTKLYYSLGSNWRQYDDHTNYYGYGQTHISGWTDRWTLKADYAESSMCHNGGIGRLWGNAMYNVNITGQGTICRTEAQKFVNGKIDIRTSCDGKPIVLFYRQIQKFDEATGLPKYDDEAKFAGLYNIMTDKSSTKLFGFEDITDPQAKKWSAENTECWECLNNGSGVVKGISLEFDSKKDGLVYGADINGDDEDISGIKGSIGDGRALWGTYEARWPDTGQERHEYDPSSNPLGNNWPDDVYGVDTKNLEGFLRWMNFCSGAIDYKIGKNGEMDGYIQNIYSQVKDETEALSHWSAFNIAKGIYDADNSTEEQKKQAEIEMNNHRLYKKWDNSGNTVYTEVGGTYKVEVEDKIQEFEVSFKEDNPGIDWYTKNWSVDMETVSKTINTKKIGKKVYIVPIPSFDSKYRCSDANGDIDENEQRKHYVDTYVTPTGDGNYEYVDNFGVTQKVTAGSIELDTENEHKVVLSAGTAPVSCSGITYMQYFSATKRDHLDLEKVAAYYIYLLRFGAVDQVVKNSMMTTEDGKKYYFINYDNDTTLGVRNDGYLIYNWDIDRNSYDKGLGGYAFAGAQSVLWNCLEMDSEFMDLVKTIDNAMNQQGLLSAEAVLTWFNERQEGVWCERLYNEQEKVKYLSTVKKDFSTDKYLGFMQGTRHSHRTWWVSHRWDLYDAKWSSGMYSLKQMSFIYTLNASTADPKDMMITTAASKYYFTLIRNTALSYSDWFKELDAEKSGVYTIRQSNSVGDPIFFYGPQKLKVLNLRPNSNSISRISLAEAYTVTNSDGTKTTSDWVTEDGAMMTKLLIGYDDTSVASTAPDISGLNKIYSLEEVDIRGMQNLNGGAPTISELANLHRWRAKNSNAITFNPKNGISLYEVSLSNLTNTISLYDVQFEADPNEYVTFQDKVISGSNANNDNNDVADGDRVTKFGRMFGDILPTYENISAYKYCKSYDSETNSLVPNFHEITNTVDGVEVGTGKWTGDYVFDYTPNENLETVIFNNVKGIDTYQFLIDWKKSLAGKDTKNYKVNITGMEWVIEDDAEGTENGKTAVQKLIDIYRTFDYTDSKGDIKFGGNIYIKKANDASLTPEEYETLKSVFGENAFKPGYNLLINCAEGMFVSAYGADTSKQSVNGTERDVYDVVKGNTFKVVGSIFPVSAEQNYVYAIKYESGFSSVAPQITVEGTKGNEVYTIKSSTSSNAKVLLTLTNKNGEGILYADPDPSYTFGTTSNDQFIGIHILKYNEYTNQPDWNEDLSLINDNVIYIKLSNRVMPTDNQIKVYDTNVSEIVPVSLEGASIKTQVKDRDIHEFAVKYDGINPNVKVSSMTVSFSANREQYAYGSTDTMTGEFITAAEIIPYTDEHDNEYYVDINNESGNQEYKFQIKHDLIRFIENPTLKVYLTMNYENGMTMNKVLEYNIVCDPAETMELYLITEDPETHEDIIAETKTNSIDITDLGTYRYKVVLDEHNIKYTTDITGKPSQTGLTIGIADDILTISVNANATTDVSGNKTINLIARPEDPVFDAILLSMPFSLVISYPDILVMSCINPNEGNVKKNVNSNLKDYGAEAFDINMTDGLGFTVNGEEDNRLVLDLEAVAKNNKPVTMSYAIEPISVTVKNTTLTFNENFDTLTFNDYETTGFVKFTPVFDEENPQLIDGNSVLSANKMKVEVNSLTAINNSADITIKYKVKYDSDKNDDTNSAYFDFVTTNGTTQIVEFNMSITRSICAATTWTKIKSINSGSGYSFYLVDKNSRFYEIPVVPNIVNNTVVSFDVNTTNAQNAGIAAEDWVGIGFRTAGSVTSTENQDSFPIFVGFKQWIGYRICSTTPSDSLMWANLSDEYKRIDRYNGNEITQALAQLDQHSMLYTILNEDTNGINYYLPSYAELSQIVNSETEAIIPSTQTLALNAAIAKLVSEIIISVERVFDTVMNQYSSGTSQLSDSEFLDISKNYIMFDNNNLSLWYFTSTISRDKNGLMLNDIQVTKNANDTYGIVLDAKYVDTTAYVQRNIWIPFVNVR